MTTRRDTVIVGLVMLGLLPVELAVLTADHVYRNHIITDCGADCRGQASQRAAQGSF